MSLILDTIRTIFNMFFFMYGLVFQGTLATRRLPLPSFSSEGPFFPLFLLISVELKTVLFCLKEGIIESTKRFQ